MLRGLVDRRIAVYCLAGGDGDEGKRRVEAFRKVVEQAGARVDLLSDDGLSDADFAGANYAVLVVLGNGADGPDPSVDRRLVQLTREFLASDKPVVVQGSGLKVILEAGGAAGRAVAADAALKSDLERAGATWVDAPIHVDGNLISARGSVDVAEFAARAVRELADRLEESQLDEMSELSFPASDPPAVTPSTIGSVGREQEGDART